MGRGRKHAKILPGALQFLPDLDREGDKGLSKAKQDRESAAVHLLSKSRGAQEDPPVEGERFQVNSEREEVDQRQSRKMNPTGIRGRSAQVGAARKEERVS